jgi:predicted amidophosphoribosyltransferase
VPFLGAVVYLLVRPAEPLAETRLREAELRVLGRRLAQREQTCHVCRTSVEDDFLVCPVCTTRLKEPCVSCGAPLQRAWQTCPYCATPVLVEVDLDEALTAEAQSRVASVGTGAGAAGNPTRASAGTVSGSTAGANRASAASAATPPTSS